SNVNIIYPTNELIESIVNNSGKGEAFIIVKSPVPFDSNTFNSLISNNVKEISVVDNTSLKLDIQASLFFKGKFSIKVVDESLESFVNR
ncbi:hypothetical protein HLX74_24175, partial [Escherichia coli]|nr:hypothetical protein [Escherichia coli]